MLTNAYKSQNWIPNRLKIHILHVLNSVHNFVFDWHLRFLVCTKQMYWNRNLREEISVFGWSPTTKPISLKGLDWWFEISPENNTDKEISVGPTSLFFSIFGHPFQNIYFQISNLNNCKLRNVRKKLPG